MNAVFVLIILIVLKITYTCTTMFLFHQGAPRQIRKRSDLYSKNIEKRGNVPIGKAENRDSEQIVSRGLIAFFLVVLIGSTAVQIFNLFRSKPIF
jgi:hypothetical protein